MKIGIYSICKNESDNFERWYENVKGADRIFVLDTGSTDGTLDLLQEKFAEDFSTNGGKKFSYNHYGHHHEFAFDTARNMSLSGLLWGAPEELDYVVWVDFDETFPENWIDQLREAMELCKESGSVPNSVQFNNHFVGSDTSWYQSRAHKPKEYQWKYSAHEVLLPTDLLVGQEVIGSCDITIVHPNKESRNVYTDLLLKSHKLYADGRTSYYLGREYYYEQDWVNASKYLRECLFVHNGWQAERGESAKMLSRIHDDDHQYAVKYLHFYLAYCNLQREPYVELARYYYEREDWASVIHYALKSLEITEKPSSYLVLDESCYTYAPHDYLMLAYDKLGDKHNGAFHAAMCLQFAPTNERFRENVQYFINEGVLRVENNPTKGDDRDI